MTVPVANPLFTRSEKRRAKKKVAHKVKGAVRQGFAKLFGIPLSPGLGGKAPRRGSHRAPSSASSAGVRGDVLSALTNLGYKKPDAEKMVPQASTGEGFDSLFRRSVKRNPSELVIFGNPERVYSRAQVGKATSRKRNLLPAAILEGLGFGVGEHFMTKALKGSSRKKRRSNIAGLSSPLLRKKNQAVDWMVEHRSDYSSAQMLAQAASTKYSVPVEWIIEEARELKRKGNPDGLDQAQDLFSKFHHREPGGVIEMQVSAKKRKDYTILGPLVAIGINAEKFDQIRPSENQVVEHWDKLPHMGFLTGSQVDEVKAILDQADQYVEDLALLASSPNGKQLYIICAEPLEIPIAQQFDTDASKDFVDLGEATFIVYIAKKPHDPIEWVHTFAEEGGTRPRIAFDRLTKQLLFIGGSYRVEGPGIIN